MADGRHRARPGAFRTARPTERESRSAAPSERLQERVRQFFYVMLRDNVPFGMLDQIVTQLAIGEDGAFEYDSEALYSLANELAEKLGAKGKLAWSKETREWIGGFPERTRESPFFEQVLSEIEGEMTLSDSTRAQVIAEVVRRERAVEEAAPEGRIVGRPPA